MNKNLLVAISAISFAIGAPFTSISASALSSYQIDDESSGNQYPLPPGPPSAPQHVYTPQVAAPSGLDLPLAGNVKILSQGQVTTACADVGSAKTEILSTNFRTGPVNKYVEINYSGQFSMGSKTVDGFNRMFLQCAIRLATQVPTDDVACAEMSNAYIVARRPKIPGTPNTYPAITTTSAYIGYVANLTPDTEYTVTFYVYTGTTPAGDLGTVCYSNMILRY